MDAAPAGTTLETLLAHRAWVRSLALALTSRRDEADDVEQETWLAAVRRPPPPDVSGGAWLTTVARNAARKLRRGALRRSRRELAASAREGAEDPEESVARAEAHARVAAAVVALPEPWRQTVVLRYFEGFSVAEVASRTGAPLETTRARLRRARELLRERLAAALGEERGGWRAALAPLLAAPSPRATATGSAAGAAAGGGAIVASKSILAVVVVASAAGTWWLASGDSEAPREARAPSASPRAAVPPPASTAPPRVHAEAGTAVETPKAPEPPAAPPSSPKEPTLAERLDTRIEGIEFRDIPVPEALGVLAARGGVTIVLSAEVAETLKGADARLEMLRLDQEVALRQALSLVTLLKGLAFEIDGERVVIVPPDRKWDRTKPVVAVPRPAPRAPFRLRGRITDAAGRPLGGASLHRVSFGWDRVVATTDDAGAFDVLVDGEPSGWLEAQAAGHVASALVPVPAAAEARESLAIALRGPAGKVRVRVLDEKGKPLAAEVTLEPSVKDVRAGELPQRPAPVACDAKGDAEIAGIAPAEVVVRAACEGFEPGTARAGVAAERASEVEIRLKPKPSLAEKLRTTFVTFQFDAAEMTDVVAYLNDATGLSIVLASRSSDTVTLSVREATVEEALRQICEQTSMKFEVKDPLVVLSRR